MRLPAAIACALLASCGSGEPCGYPGNYCPVPPMPAKSTVSARPHQMRAVVAGGPGASWVSLRPAGNCATGHPEQTGLQPDEATARDVGAVKTEHRAARCVGQAAPIHRVSSRSIGRIRHAHGADLHIGGRPPAALASSIRLGLVARHGSQSLFFAGAGHSDGFRLIRRPT